MRLLRARRAARFVEDDRGAGLVLVIGSMMVLSMLALAALASAAAGQRMARHSQDYAAAAAAAQSGVEEFISRLNRSDSYGTTIDCSNPAWRGPTSSPNPCGWTTATPVGWAPVEPGETDPDGAWFHYQVDTAARATQGAILLTVTGRVNGVHRTMETAVGKGGSTDYVYYTDYESADPANRVYYPTSTTSGWSTAKRNACGINGNELALYWWEKDGAGRTRDYYDCTEITFTSGDVLDGAVRTNDTIYGSLRSGSSVKPLFKEQVTTADERCTNPGTTNNQWQTNCLRAGSVADFNGVPPQYGNPEYLEDHSGKFATHPGCHYVGSTRVVFQSNGTMRVWNPRSVNGNVAPVAIASETGAMPTCGTLDALDSTAGATVPVPHEMVVYVDHSSVPARECFGGELGGPSAARELPIGNYNGTAAGPGKSYTRDTNMTESTKLCNKGNLYAEGVVKGRVTLASAESIVVTGDLVLAGGTAETSPDMLGLVATNSVEVFHPRQVTVSSQSSCNRWGACTWSWGSPGPESEVPGWPTRYTDPTTGAVNPPSGVQIAGSIQTLQHSFLVQKYNVGGDLGNLVVIGSIAQRWRGIVGQEPHGYTKKYSYDRRLRFSAPPYFPKWANARWTLRYQGEIPTPDDVRNG